MGVNMQGEYGDDMLLHIYIYYSIQRKLDLFIEHLS